MANESPTEGLEPEDYAARIRAALAYARIDDKTAADSLHFSIRTLNRMLANTRSPTVPELKAIAKLTEVPLGFLVDGWRPRVRPRTAEQLLDEMRRISREMQELSNRQGRDIGLRDLERRQAEDPPSELPPAAAGGN